MYSFLWFFNHSIVVSYDWLHAVRGGIFSLLTHSTMQPSVAAHHNSEDQWSTQTHKSHQSHRTPDLRRHVKHTEHHIHACKPHRSYRTLDSKDPQCTQTHKPYQPHRTLDLRGHIKRQEHHRHANLTGHTEHQKKWVDKPNNHLCCKTTMWDNYANILTSKKRVHILCIMGNLYKF